MNLQTTLTKVKTTLNTPRFTMALTGILLVGCISTAMPGGDGLRFFLRPWFAETSAPGWVYLLTAPLAGALGFRLAYAFWAMLTAAVVLAAVWGKGPGALAVFISFPFIWLVDIAQIEALPVAGFLLALWAVRGRKPTPFYALAAVLLLSKLGVGWLPAAYLFILAWQRGPAGLAWMVAAFSALVLLSVAVVGDWPAAWLNTTLLGVDDFTAGAWRDGSMWPLGLALLPVVIFPFKRESAAQRLAILAAASPLAFPYLRPYHLILSLIIALPLLARIPLPRLFGAAAENDHIFKPLALVVISWILLFFPEAAFAFGIILFGVIYYGIWKSTRSGIRNSGRAWRG